MSIPEWRVAFIDKGGIGYQTFRNHYRLDGSDLVVQVNAKTHAPGGYGGPDALGLRIVGLRGGFVVGGGRYGVKGANGWYRPVGRCRPRAGPWPAGQTAA